MRKDIIETLQLITAGRKMVCDAVFREVLFLLFFFLFPIQFSYGIGLLFGFEFCFGLRFGLGLGFGFGLVLVSISVLVLVLDVVLFRLFSLELVAAQYLDITVLVLKVGSTHSSAKL
jgi:hypothetical protein